MRAAQHMSTPLSGGVIIRSLVSKTGFPYGQTQEPMWRELIGVGLVLKLQLGSLLSLWLCNTYGYESQFFDSLCELCSSGQFLVAVTEMRGQGPTKILGACFQEEEYHLGSKIKCENVVGKWCWSKHWSSSKLLSLLFPWKSVLEVLTVWLVVAALGSPPSSVWFTVSIKRH